MSIIDQVRTTSAGRIAAAEREYRVLLGRSATPQPGDADQMAAVMTTLTLSTEDVEADANALGEVGRDEAKLVPAAQISRIVEKLQKQKEVDEKLYHELMHRLLDLYLSENSLNANNRLFQLMYDTTHFTVAEPSEFKIKHVDLMRKLAFVFFDTDQMKKQNSRIELQIARTKVAHPRIFPVDDELREFVRRVKKENEFPFDSIKALVGINRIEF